MQPQLCWSTSQEGHGEAPIDAMTSCGHKRSAESALQNADSKGYWPSLGFVTVVQPSQGVPAFLACYGVALYTKA